MYKNIVIIDDSDYKVEGIKGYLKKLYPDATFHSFGCVNASLRFIAWNNYDEIQENPNEWLMVIDMVMPRMYDTFPEREAGYSVLAEMQRRRMTCNAIVVSSETIDLDKAKKAYKHFLGSVKYDCSVYNLEDYKKLLV